MQRALAVLNLVLISLIIFFLGQSALTFAENAKAKDRSQLDSMRAYIVEEYNKFSSFRYNKLKFKDSDSNLYLTLLNEIAFLSDDKARKSMTNQPGVREGNLDEQILDNQARREDYYLERDFFKTLAKHEAEIVALEIFVNGSTKDADFDLLDDLNKIERIMFDEESSSQFAESLERSEKNLSSLASNEAYLYDDTQENTSFDTAAESDLASSDQLTIGLSQEDPLYLDEDVCQVDEELSNSLDSYNEDIELAVQETAESNLDGSTASTLGSQDPKANRLALGDIQDAKKECPDGAMFCVTIEKIWATESSYTVSDRDCIDCLVQELQLYSEELVSESVAAHSLPGEAFQPNICTKSFALNSLGLEFNLVKKPLLQNDEADILTSSSPSQVASRIAEAQNISTNEDSDPIGDALEGANIGGSVSSSDLIQQTQSAEATSQDQAQIQSNLADVQSLIESNDILASALSNRMKASLAYFESYYEILSEIEAKLRALKDKPVCPS